jgi:hypothetical protein
LPRLSRRSSNKWLKIELFSLIKIELPGRPLVHLRRRLTIQVKLLTANDSSSIAQRAASQSKIGIFMIMV